MYVFHPFFKKYIFYISKDSLKWAISTLYPYVLESMYFCKVDLNNKICSCAWYVDKGIWKHLVAACIKTTSNLPGLVLVTRWQRKKPVYLSSLVKVRTTDEEPIANVDDVVSPVSENIVVTVSDVLCQIKSRKNW